MRTAFPRDMRRHIEANHTKKKGVESKHKCRVCKRGFARNDHLKRHMRLNSCGKGGVIKG